MINNKLVQHKQQRIHRCRQSSTSYRFFNLLTSEEMLDEVESLLPDHRERLFPPTETLSMFLAQALDQDRSCQKAVNDSAVNRAVGGLPRCSTLTGGYCRARKRLPLEMVSRLTRFSGQLIEQQLPHRWRWQGRRTLLIDGTTVTMPDTKDNQEAFPQQGGQKAGLGFPISRVVGVICLSSGAVLNAAIGAYKGKGSSEQRLVREMLDTFDAGDLLLGDANFGSYFFLCSLKERDIDAVFEQMGSRKRNMDFRMGKHLGAKDHVVELKKPKLKSDWMSQAQYDAAPNSLSVRELKVGRKVLVTTILSPKSASKKQLGSLYRERWHVELDIRNLKTTLGMETFSCKTPEMVEKEMWVYFLAYNLIRVLMAQAAILVKLIPRQISFKHTVQIWCAWYQLRSSGHEKVDEDFLFTLIAQGIAGHRPGRIEPRAVKRRPKQCALLTEPRQQARKNIRWRINPKGDK